MWKSKIHFQTKFVLVTFKCNLIMKNHPISCIMLYDKFSTKHYLFIIYVFIYHIDSNYLRRKFNIN